MGLSHIVYDDDDDDDYDDDDYDYIRWTVQNMKLVSIPEYVKIMILGYIFKLS